MPRLIYVDSSAVMKLVDPEPETPALVTELDADDNLVSSALLGVEVRRAAARIDSAAAARAELVLDTIVLRAIDAVILAEASTMEPQQLRSLDAIHVASALSLGADLDAICTYDNRMTAAAHHAGLTVMAPA